jgi:NAD(P)-dependent dehydrogenase (short-subunit alcohol dehydrogenase family)
VAQALARAGDTVILGCRSGAGSAVTRDRILARSPDARVAVLPIDLSSRGSIREAVRRVSAEYPKLDVLVNNASAWWMDRRVSVDGVELVWATNVLGPFLLTRLLLPLLRASGAGRIVNVASRQAGGLDLHDVELTRLPYNGFRAYQASKQAVRMLTWAFAARLRDEPIVANALCPGFMKTALGRNASLGFRFMLVALRPLQVSAERGARTAVWLASSPQAGAVSNQFFIDCRSAPCRFRDPAECDELYQLCEQAADQPVSKPTLDEATPAGP